MKTNIITLAALASTALSVQSCGDETAMQSPATDFTIMASVSDDGLMSRTAIDPTEYGDGRVGILWTADDRVGVYSDKAKNVLFTTTQTGGRVPFTGPLSTDDTPRYAYYPYSTDNDGLDAGQLKGYLPLQQTWSEDETIDGDYKYGKLRNNTDNEFDFNHLFALLRFNVNATGTNLSGETLESVEIALPQGRVLGGDFTFSAIDGSYRFNTTAISSAANVLTLTWDNAALLAEGSAITGYASCAPDIMAGDEVTVTVTTNKSKATFKAEAAYDFAAETLYTFDITLRTYQDDPKYGFAVESVGGGDEPVDDNEETANCYMITTTGEHDFKATVIGNGEKGIIKGVGFHTEDPNIDPKSAKLLWEDTQGFITDVTLTDGRVHYKANTNVGNAVIAVYSGADCTGDILWSWHIWGVGDTLPEDVEVTNRNGAVFIVLDRTLGATSVTSYNVMLYQWGRKDPFPNAETYYVEGNAVNIEKEFPLYDGTEVTLKTFVQNPGELATLPYTENTRYLWGDNNITDIYTWGWSEYLDKATAEETSGWTDQKTIYDPSPVGYRVSSKYCWTGFIDNKQGSNAGGTNGRLSYVNHIKYDHGFYFKRNSTDEEGIFFPQSGSRSATTGSLWVGGNAPYNTVDYTASYWSSAPQKNAGYGQQMSIGVYVSNNGSSVANTYNTVNTLDYAYIQNAYAVRCVRE